jgi:hypothetical protein
LGYCFLIRVIGHRELMPQGLHTHQSTPNRQEQETMQVMKSPDVKQAITDPVMARALC